MDWSKLPLELTEEIFKYLTTQELLSCHLVSVFWRNTLNNNRLWFQKCKFFADNISELEWIESSEEVDPSFTYPKNTCSRLTDLCPWRLRLMQEQRLLKNWRDGNCKQHILFKKHRFMKIKWDCDDVNIVCVSTLNKGKCRVWSFDGIIEEKKNLSLTTRHNFPKSIKVGQNKLIVVQSTLVQIFERNTNNSFELTGRFIFNKNYSQIINPLTHDVSDFYEYSFQDMLSEFDCYGKYFIAAIYQNRHVDFYIWDIEKFEKISQLSLPDCETETNIEVSSIYLLVLSHYLYIGVETDASHKITKICSYNLIECKYTSLQLKFDKCLSNAIFSKQFIIISDDKSILLYDSENGSLVKSVPIGTTVENSSSVEIQLFGHMLTMFGGDPPMYCWVKIFDLKQSKLISHLDIYHRIDEIIFIQPNILLIRNILGLTLYDVDTQSQLYRLPSILKARINSNKTKMIVENDNGSLFVLNFW